MKKKQLCFSLMLIANMVNAGSVETRKEDKVDIYNFSTKLQNAAKNCSQ